MSEQAKIDDTLNLGIRAFQKGQYEKAHELLSRFAEEGDTRAQVIMARLYYAGHGVPKDETKYLYWLEKAADNGDKAAKAQVKRIKRGSADRVGFSLTDQQLRFFDIFGYLSLPGLFANDIAKISQHFDSVFESCPDDVVYWVHKTHEDRPRRFITDAIEKDAYLASLLDDARIKTIASTILGESYACRGSDVSIYDCGTTFHQDGIDTAKPNSINIKMAFYLEDIDGPTGALRVIPGSHHRGDKFYGKLTKNWMDGDLLGLSTEEMPATVLASSPGDLLLWDYRLMHATSYGGNTRRMLALEFAQQ